MNNMCATKQHNSHKLGTVAMQVINLAVKPFGAVSSFLARHPSESDYAKEQICAKAEKPSECRKSTATSALQQLNSVRTKMFDLVESNEWIALSDLIKDWDQSRAAANDETRLARHALFAVADALAVGPGVNGMPDIADESIERLANIYALQPECYPLAAICAYLHICQVWNLQGTDRNSRINDDYKDEAKSKRKFAKKFLAPHDPKTLNSPLLAGVRFDTLPLLSKTGDLTKRYYKEWAALDLEDQVPHAEYYFLRLPN